MPRDVPYYEQTAEFSCGPACILMAINAHDPDFGLSREREFEVWREANMVGVRGADPWGLAVPFLRRRFATRVITERETAFATDRWREFFEPEEVALGEWAMEDNRRRARDLGVEEEIRPPAMDDVEAALDAGELPVCMVNMRLMHGEEIPHWIVATGADADGVTFHDPYPPKGRADVRLSRDEFWSLIEDVADDPILGARSVVVVGPA